MPRTSAIAPDTLRDWQARMEYSNVQAAEALGMSLSAYVQLRTGKSRTSGYPIRIDLRTALACAAIEAGIPPVK